MHHMKVCILYAYVKELRDGDERDIISDKSRQGADTRPHANLPELQNIKSGFSIILTNHSQCFRVRCPRFAVSLRIEMKS